MPPPDQRSRTVSPGLRSANAVGLPQPSEASAAVTGSSLFWSASYRSAVMGSGESQQAETDAVAPQQALPCPRTTRIAAWPYFSFTVS